MDFERAQQEVMDWIVSFVEKPTPLLNDWPPCPYARQARLQNRVELKQGIQDPYADAELAEMGNMDVIGYIYDPAQFDPTQFNQLVDRANRDWLLSRDMIALADHPGDQEIVNGVCMNQGTWAIMFLQNLSKLNHHAGLIARQGFYDNWPEEYLQVLFQNRRDPRQ